MKCLIRLKYKKTNQHFPTNDSEGKEFNTGLIETKSRTKNREQETSFGEEFDLEPLFSLDAVFHLRVYEPGLLNNSFVCEVRIPVRASLAGSRNPKGSIGVDTPIVQYHNLYDKDLTRPLGQVQLGLHIARK